MVRDMSKRVPFVYLYIAIYIYSYALVHSVYAYIYIHIHTCVYVYIRNRKFVPAEPMDGPRPRGDPGLGNPGKHLTLAISFPYKKNPYQNISMLGVKCFPVPLKAALEPRHYPDQ